MLDASGRPLGGVLPSGGAALVAQIAPDGSRVATLELLAELAPPPITAPPGTPPLLGFHPYLFIAAPDGSDRAVVARDVVDTAWLGGRLLRSDVSLPAAVRPWTLPAGLEHRLPLRARRGARPGERPVGAGGVTR